MTKLKSIKNDVFLRSVNFEVAQVINIEGYVIGLWSCHNRFHSSRSLNYFHFPVYGLRIPLLSSFIFTRGKRWKNMIFFTTSHKKFWGLLTQCNYIDSVWFQWKCYYDSSVIVNTCGILIQTFFQGPFQWKPFEKKRLSKKLSIPLKGVIVKGSFDLELK